jgi:hypothetical protein
MCVTDYAHPVYKGCHSYEAAGLWIWTLIALLVRAKWNTAKTIISSDDVIFKWMCCVCCSVYFVSYLSFGIRDYEQAYLFVMHGWRWGSNSRYYPGKGDFQFVIVLRVFTAVQCSEAGNEELTWQTDRLQFCFNSRLVWGLRWPRSEL